MTAGLSSKKTDEEKTNCFDICSFIQLFFKYAWEMVLKLISSNISWKLFQDKYSDSVAYTRNSTEWNYYRNFFFRVIISQAFTKMMLLKS